MIQPDFREFKKLARTGTLIAVSKTIPADLETPVSCFLKLAGSQPNAFLLESAEQGEKNGRYSLIGLEPDEILSAASGRVTLKQGRRSRALPGDRSVQQIMRERLACCKLANPGALAAFSGGYVGYFSYENVVQFEDIRLRDLPQGPRVPETLFFLTREYVIFDHFRKTLSFVYIAPVPEKSPKLKSAYRAALRRIETRSRMLNRPLRLSRERPKSSGGENFRSNMKPLNFSVKVRKIKNYIRAGDCIQVVLSQRFRIAKVAEDFQVYRALRSINPSPYMFYFRAGKVRLIGSSPEMLVRKSGRDAELRPIAGTRPRGRDAQEDLRHEEHLKKSPKEMAEHLMLVDLGRNDLGRVCEFKSVQVRQFARVERYSHVMHLVSDVAGRLRRGKDAFDLLKAVFPAGTVTGAPKIRAMQIINELEPETRGPYAGALGYFSFTGDMDMCITIRTLVQDARNLFIQAGAGVVKDSSPEREYAETISKAKALFKAVRMRGEY